MIAESVSKAASGEELGVDDTRFEEMMADINDDEDLLATGRAQKRARLSPPLYTKLQTDVTDARTPAHTRSRPPVGRSQRRLRYPRSS
jgi:hypothetical protein